MRSYSFGSSELTYARCQGKDFTVAYYRLARRYHPDLNRNCLELMANINAARAAILKARQFR
jgi:DnaJ-class molecular chaperone